MGLATIPEAVADFAAGKLVIVVDDEDRENEGDLVVAAELVTAEHISFMTRHGSGLEEDDARPFFSNRVDRSVKLRAAVGAQAAEDVIGQALGARAEQDRAILV